MVKCHGFVSSQKGILFLTGEKLFR